MAKISEADAKILALTEKVEKEEAAIANIKKPIAYSTNCFFSYTETKDGVNIQVESNVGNLIKMASFLRDKQKSYNETTELFGVDAPEFKWSGYSVNDWLEDIKNRINKIQLIDREKKLKSLKTRLANIMSADLKTQKELEAIENELD